MAGVVRARVPSAPEASGCLVAPPVFKTGGRRSASSAGSIPVRLRYQRKLRSGGHRWVYPESCFRPGSARCWHKRSLAREFGVAVVTVRKALDVPRDEGIVRTEPGWGTFVIPEGERDKT